MSKIDQGDRCPRGLLLLIVGCGAIAMYGIGSLIHFTVVQRGIAEAVDLGTVSYSYAAPAAADEVRWSETFAPQDRWARVRLELPPLAPSDPAYEVYIGWVYYSDLGDGTVYPGRALTRTFSPEGRDHIALPAKCRESLEVVVPYQTVGANGFRELPPHTFEVWVRGPNGRETKYRWLVCS